MYKCTECGFWRKHTDVRHRFDEAVVCASCIKVLVMASEIKKGPGDDTQPTAA